MKKRLFTLILILSMFVGLNKVNAATLTDAYMKSLYENIEAKKYTNFNDLIADLKLDYKTEVTASDQFKIIITDDTGKELSSALYTTNHDTNTIDFQEKTTGLTSTYLFNNSIAGDLFILGVFDKSGFEEKETLKWMTMHSDEVDKLTLADNGIAIEKGELVDGNDKVTYIKSIKTTGLVKVEMDKYLEVYYSVKKLSPTSAEIVLDAPLKKESDKCTLIRVTGTNSLEEVAVNNCETFKLDNLTTGVEYQYQVLVHRNLEKSDIITVKLSETDGTNTDQTSTNTEDTNSNAKSEEKVSNPKTGIEDYIVEFLSLAALLITLYVAINKKNLFRKI